MRGTRIRWTNVAKLAGGVGLGAALLFVVPALLATPEPPPLEPDIGLTPSEETRPEPGPIPDVAPTSDGPDADCERGSDRRRAAERSAAPAARLPEPGCRERRGQKPRGTHKRSRSRDRARGRARLTPGRSRADVGAPAPVTGAPSPAGAPAPSMPTPTPQPDPTPPLIREFGL